jgi:hypothetical protein
MNTKKTMQAETDPASKRRGYRFFLSCFALILGLPLLLYYGYCWGWWGRNSLLLPYLFQCNCPPASEEARYPDQVDVIVPACQYVNSILSPSGRLLYVEEKEVSSTSTYMLDLQTNEKISFMLPNSAFYFLTDDLLYVFIYSKGDEYILDRTTGMKYPLQRYISLQPSAYSYGEVDPGLLFRALLQVERVFLIDAPSQPVITLSSDFRTHPEHSFIFNESDLPGEDSNQVEQFLQQNNILYYHVADNFSDEAVSPDGRFIARADGIYLVTTNQRIVEGYSASRFYRSYSRKYFKVKGWTHDGRGVIYSKFLNPCLIETNFFIFDDSTCYYEVSQPVLKLKVPEEYVLPAQTP